MSEESYRVFGTPPPQMHGRKDDWQRLMRRLEKSVPDHVSVIGPRYIGKTVLLTAVADYFTNNTANFNGCAYWNIGHDTPETDAAFYSAFAKYVGQAIDNFGVVTDYLDVKNAGFEELRDAFETLEADEKKILIIMDGLDHLRHNAELSKNLWDSLRALGEKSSLRFLIGSQKPLREICATPEARTSPFWNLFADSTIKLGAFDKGKDWEDVLTPFSKRSMDLQTGARTELFNFCGGIPVLASALCKRVWNCFDNGARIEPADVVKLSDGFVDDVRSILDDLWEDCDAEEQGIIAQLASGSSLEASAVSRDCRLRLRQRGIVYDERQGLKLCRPFIHYVTTYRPQANDLRRLFGTAEDFKSNIRHVIELRVVQLQNTLSVDSQLTDYVRAAVQKLERPHLVVNEIRGFVNRAFSIIWDQELPDRSIPPEWTLGWKMEDREGNRPENNPPNGQVPSSRGGQCYLLGLMTDPRKSGRTRVSRSSYFMLDYLRSVGDFGQHLDGATVPESFTYTVCLTAIELCQQLGVELNSA